MVAEGEEGGGGLAWEAGVSRGLAKVLLRSTGHWKLYPMINHSGKEYEKYIYIIESLCYTAEINPVL